MVFSVCVFFSFFLLTSLTSLARRAFCQALCGGDPICVQSPYDHDWLLHSDWSSRVRRFTLWSAWFSPHFAIPSSCRSWNLLACRRLCPLPASSRHRSVFQAIFQAKWLVLTAHPQAAFPSRWKLRTLLLAAENGRHRRAKELFCKSWCSRRGVYYTLRYSIAFSLIFQSLSRYLPIFSWKT